NGKFVYAASDNVIAYPGRNISYKYGTSSYFVVYMNVNNLPKKSGVEIPSASTMVIISDNNIKTQSNELSKFYELYEMPKTTDKFEYIKTTDVRVNLMSQDDHFHCNNDIKPRSVKFIKN
ncbi:hypothetical protein, partial [Pectobacterium odoriferum]